MLEGGGAMVAAIEGWLALTVIMSQLQGWPMLMRCFPEIKEKPVAHLSAQWVGLIQYQGRTLNVSAGPSGLRLSQWRVLAPLIGPSPFHGLKSILNGLAIGRGFPWARHQQLLVFQLQNGRRWQIRLRIAPATEASAYVLKSASGPFQRCRRVASGRRGSLGPAPDSYFLTIPRNKAPCGLS